MNQSDRLEIPATCAIDSREMTANYPNAILYLFILIGGRGGGTLALVRRVVGLQNGLPMGQSTRWTFCRSDLTH